MAATTIGRSLFRGVIFITPFFKSYGEKIEKKAALIKALCYILPGKRFSSAPKNEWPAGYLENYAHFLADESRKVPFMRADTGVLILDMFSTIKEEVKSIDMPLCFVSVSKEDRVDNSTTDEIASYAKNKASEEHMIEGADHSNIVFDEVHVRPMMFKTLAFLDKLR